MEANGSEFGLANLASPCEMPRTDDRVQGQPYRYGFAVMGRQPDGSSSVGRVDVTTGKWEVWAPGPASSVQEPQFVPRHPGAPEGDGWLLVLVNRFAENRSDMVVLDAQNLAAGPVCVVKVPIRVRATFHGVWAPRRAMQTGLYASVAGAAE
jgi:carotenoid cleavage dioxygenase